MRSTIVLGGVVAALVASPSSVRAGGADTTDIACGMVPASWNAPRGAVVSLRNDDAIAGVVDSVGEYNTHVILSHGIGSLATHAIAHTPGLSAWPTVCSRPVRSHELAHGYPGASRIDQGGAYTLIYGFHLEHTGVVIPTDWESRDRAERTADLGWYGLPDEWVPSRRDPVHGLNLLSEDGDDHVCQRNWYSDGVFYLNCPDAWRGTGNGCDCGCQWADPDCNAGDFRPLEYSSFQYRDLQDRHLGSPDVTNNGVQCSSLFALFYHRETGDFMAPYTYDHAHAVAAAEGLYQRVERQCNEGLGFWGQIGSALLCFENICDDAARQVRNCFLDPAYCDSDSEVPWMHARTDPSQVATTISPDRLLGQSGHPGQGAPHVGPWAGQAEVPLTWNAPGATYGCWY